MKQRRQNIQRMMHLIAKIYSQVWQSMASAKSVFIPQVPYSFVLLVGGGIC